MAQKKLVYEMPLSVDVQLRADARGRRLEVAGIDPRKAERTLDAERGMVIFTQIVEVKDDGGPSGQGGERD